jgi:hypothetical protein
LALSDELKVAPVTIQTTKTQKLFMCT